MALESFDTQVLFFITILVKLPLLYYHLATVD